MLGLVSPLPTAWADDGETVSLTAGQKALAEAASSGERVEVTSERSEYATVYANPDGETFTLEQAVAPVRVAKSGGGWSDPDPTLVQRSDGSVGPKAAVADIDLSAGGSDRLATIAEKGRSLSLHWPGGDLPKPTLSGDTATYTNVLPDVDLKVTATVEGFQQVLVVKTPEAAAGDKLKQLDFALDSNQLTVKETAGGGLSAKDPNGKQVFTAPPAHMWDSAGDATTASPTLKSTQTVTTDGSETTDKTNGPEPGDTVTDMDVQVSDGKLSVTPDAGMLADTPESDFPLYIDPSIGWGESERTLLRSDGYEDYAWTGDEGVGECGTWGGYKCGDGYRQRLYFEFSPSKLRGKHVLDATFRVTETWSFTCTPSFVQLWRTGNISSSSSWPGPSHINMMGDRKVSAGRGDKCSPSQPAAPIEFHDNPAESNENLTPTVRSFAEGNFSRFTLALEEADETDTGDWKRFKHDAVLDVDYVGLPARPTQVGLSVGDSAVCQHDAGSPQVSTDSTPKLTSTVQTKSGGESGANLRAYFDIDVQNSDGSWSDSPVGSGGSLRPASGYVGDGTKENMDWDQELAEGPLYRYRTWVRSYYDSESGKYLSGGSNATGEGWCYFTVDKSAPKTPSVSVSAPYSQCLPNDCAAGGGPGTAAHLTVQAADGDTDIDSFAWRIAGDTDWNTAQADSSGAATIAFTPQASGTKELQVYGVDVHGRAGDWSTLDFLVKPGEGPVGRWHFNESSGAAVDSATAADSARQDMSLVNSATRDDRGRRGVLTADANGDPLPEPVTDRGLVLDGSGAGAHTDGPVLETRSSYTVSAWARLDSADSDAIVLSQDGDHYSSFLLWYETDYHRWMFGVKESDTDTGKAYFGVVSDNAPVVGAWTHLAGTYDPGTQKVTLYVNGKAQGSTTAPGSWNSTGDFQVGRYLWADNRYYPFNGSIDEVSVWQRVLTPQEIADEARLMTSDGHAGVELVAAWDPSTGSGTEVPDTVSGYGHDLTLSGGASLDGESIVLDGTDGAASASGGPLVDDTGSFTATTLVDLDSSIADMPVGSMVQVLGQPTASDSSWGLWFKLTAVDTVLDDDGVEQKVPVGRWYFGRPDSTFVASNTATQATGTVRLTGVYDEAGTVSLYVSDLQQGETKQFTTQPGQGAFQLGRGKAGGSWSHYLPGRISDVRVWAGAMANAQQIRDTVGE